jgi:hypothetical protein
LAAALASAPGMGSRAWQEAKTELGDARETVDRIEAWLEGPTHDRASGRAARRAGPSPSASRNGRRSACRRPLEQ